MLQKNAFKLLPRLLMLLALTGMSACKKTSSDSLAKLVSGDANEKDQTSSFGDIKLSIVGGNNQIGAPGTVFPDPLKVQLLKNGEPIQGAEINFGVTSGVSGSFSASTVSTDSSGMASTSFIAGSGPGVSVIAAVYQGVEVEFNENVVSQSGVISRVSGNGQTGEVGTMANNPLIVQVIDSETGKGLPGILISFAVVAGNGRINSTSNLYTATTDGNGRTSVPFQLGTVAGPNVVEASIASLPSQMVDFSLTGSVPLSSAISLSKSQVSLSQTSAPADGSTTVTARLQLKDQYGNNLPKAGQSVSFNINTGTFVGSVADLGGGAYSQTIRVPNNTNLNPMTVGASVNGEALTSSPATIELIAGNVDLAVSTISSNASQLVADGVSNTVITVTLKDSLGNVLGVGGENVVISSTLGSMVGSVSDNGDGTYSQTIKSSYVAGDAVITATVGGSSLSSSLNFPFVAGAADLSESVITVSPGVIPPDGESTSLVTVSLRDQYGNQLQSSAGTVDMTTNAGSWSGSVIDNGDGTYQRVLVSPLAAGSTTISASLNGSPLAKTAKVYFSSGSSGPSVNHSSIEILGGSSKFPADGSKSFTVRVTLRDSSNQQLEQGGNDVSVSISSGSLIGGLIDNGNGTYDQALRAPSVSSIGNITATVDGASLASGTTAYFYGSISLTQSTLKSFPEAIEANGTDTSLLVLQAKDDSGISIPVGGETGIVLSSDAGTLLGSLSDNGNGTYTQYLQSSTVSETATVSVAKDAVNFSDTASVEFFIANNLAGVVIDCSNIASYKNTNILVDNGTLVMNSIENATDCSSDFIFKSVTLRNSAVLTHKKTTLTIKYGLSFSANSVSIDGASSIDVSGKGYLADGTTHQFRVQGNQLVKNRDGDDIYGAVGGTHAGQGGMYRSYDNTTFSYGNLFRPFTLGASGATSYPGRNPGHGGGRVKIKIINGGTLTVNGSIKAEGTIGHSAEQAGAGAGGSVWIETGTIKGNGFISANGGSDPYGAGGGGRVALYYETAADAFAYPSSIVDAVRAFGGVGNTNNANGAAGTVYLKSATQTFGDLSLNNGGKIAAYGKTFISAPAATVPDGVTSTTITKTGHFQDVYAQTPSPYIGYFLNPDTAQNATPERADDIAFLVAGSDGNSVSVNGGNLLDYSDGSQNFELILKFDNLQIAGGANYSGGSELIVLNGDISSGGQKVAYNGRFEGSSVEFGELQSFSIDGGGDSAKASYGDISVSGDIVIKNGSFQTGKLTGQNLTLDGAHLITGQPVKNLSMALSGGLTIRNNSIIEQIATDASVERSLEIKAASLVLEAGSLITASGKGYLPSVNDWVTRGLGNIDTTHINGSTSRAGGSHGGLGGVYSSAGQHIPVYGSLTNPHTSGSSGAGRAGDSNYLPHPGGGIVRIDLSGGDAQINGSVDVSGAGTNYNYRSGGAGGSIWINAGELSGTGSLIANGGVGGSAGGTGGGGGRIALYYTSATGGFAYPVSIQSRVSAFGGDGGGADSSKYGDGGAGTIYLKSSTQTYGDLIVKNNNNSGADFSSTFISLRAGISATLSATSLGDPSSFGEGEGKAYNTNHLAGFRLSPKADENATDAYLDNTLFEITSQTRDELSIGSGDMLTAAAAGDAYQIVAVFDNVEISDGGFLESNGPVIATQGDLSSNDTSTLAWTGSFVGKNLETPNNVKLIGHESSVEKVLAQSLALDGAILSAGSLKGETALDLNGPLSLKNSSILKQRPSTETEEYALDINSSSLVVDSTSQILAVEAGYVNPSASSVSTWFGKSIHGPMTTGLEAGGSHGGRGGNADSWGNTVPTYGNLYRPYSSGSSGLSHVWNSGNYLAHHGGGIIKIDTNGGFATIDGIIDASGGGSTYSSQVGGAGGSVWIQAGALSGTGTIKANGGLGGPSGAGGGGGRIAVYYDSASGGFSYPSGMYSQITAFGGEGRGADAAYGDGGAGTIYLKSSAQVYGDLIVRNNGLPAADSSPTHINITSSGTSDSLSSTSLSRAGAFDEEGFLTKHLIGAYLSPNKGQNSTPSFNDDTLFKIVDQDSNTLTIGSGDMTSIASSGDAYQIVLVFDNLQIAGDAQLESDAPILVKKGDLLSLDDVTVALGGGDNGGATEYVGVSSFVVNSGEHTYRDLTVGGNLELRPGANLEAQTLNVAGNLSVDSAVVAAGTSDYKVNLSVTGDINLINGGVISQKETTLSDEYRLSVKATNLTIDSASSIDVSALGYKPDLYEHTRSYGNLNYKTYNNDNDGHAGGSHGGRGGRVSIYDSVYEVHGNFRRPAELGGSSSHIYGGAGGGAVKLNLSGNLVLDGAIKANGEDGASYSAGAGGSVWIEALDISGAGSIEANGGVGNYGGGGGGRVALYYDTLSGDFSTLPLSSKIHAHGGTHSINYRNGGAGTIFLKGSSQTYGDMIINNNGNEYYERNFTHIPAASSSSSSFLNANSLGASISNPYNEENQFTGLFLNPNTGQNGTTAISDDTLYEISGNTLSAINTSAGDMTSVASAGDGFRLTLALDNLELIGNAHVVFAGQDVLVTKGDLSSGDDLTFVLNGKLNANIVDTGAADYFVGASGDDTDVITVCANNVPCP